MNDVDKKNIATLLITIGQVYAKQVTQPMVTLYLESLKDIPVQKILMALKLYVKQASSRTFPTIGDIRALAVPVVDKELLAREISTKIITAMSKYGWTNPDRARKYIGELGWKVVELESGWEHMCENTTMDQVPFIKAQLRELIKAQMIRHPELVSEMMLEQTTKLIREQR